MNARLNPVARAAEEAAQTELDRLLARPFRPQDLMTGDSLDRIERIAMRMAEGRMTVPEYLRGNIGDCMAIAMQAMLWNMDPFAVAQKTHIVSGRLGYEAQLVNAVLQNSGAIRNAPMYEYRGDGDSIECRVGCVLRGEEVVRWGEWLSIKAITTKNSPLWKTNPRQQMGYLQVKNWARAFAPGAILGVYTVDELLDGDPVADPTVVGGQAPAAPPPPAPPATWPDAAFNGQLQRWSKAVAAGMKTSDDILALARSKGALTPAQEAQIKALVKAPEPDPAAGPEPEKSATDEFVAGYESAEQQQ